MFRMIPVPKSKSKMYVITSMFHCGDWFLRDAKTENGVTTRVWTSNFIKALVFSSERDAEHIGSLVLKDDDFIIESISVQSI